MARETLFNGQLQFAYNPVYGAYGSGIAPSPFALVAGESYTVSWNGEEYTRTAFAADTFSPGAVGLGNAAFIGGAADPDGLAFIIGYLPAENQVAILTTLPDESHTIGIYQGEEEPEEPEEPEAAVYYCVSSISLKAIGNAIRAKNGTTDPLSFPDEMVEAINGITTGGGSSEDVRYVTFMNGDQVLFVKPVAVGDDCADVIARGLIGTPTKESTAQYDYTYSGWSLTDGGSASSAALSSVTEDRTVYAAYTSAVRKYTITFYDDDGVTVLKTLTASYGSTITYEPVKQGYNFVEWSPALAEVTGDASYVASFEIASFYTMSWADISAASTAGTAANMFAVGDTKPVRVNGKIGTVSVNMELLVYILGFDHNSAVEGSGIHLGCFKYQDTTRVRDVAISTHASSTAYAGDNKSDGSLVYNMNHWGAASYGGWKGSDMRYDILGSTDVAPSGYGAAQTTSREGYDPTETCATNPVANTLMAALPADLRAVMKPIKKYYSRKPKDTGSIVTEFSMDYLPLLSYYEITGKIDYNIGYATGETSYQKQYAYYAAGNEVKKTIHTVKYNGTATPYWLRSNGSSAYLGVGVNFSGAIALCNSSNDTGLAPILMV